jgi:hypothetical protein
MKMIRWLGIGVAIAAVSIALFAWGARLADGPIGMFPGGPFESGDWVSEELIDWTFAANLPEIELQSGSPARSRTTWILVAEGEAYVPCSLSFPPGKSWHREALQDPDAVVRIEGKRYRRKLVKIDDPPLEQQLLEAAQRKYQPPPSSAGVWFFRLAAPAR